MIHKIDDWTIVKLLGGFAVVLTAVIGFFSKYLLNKFAQTSQHGFDKKLEDMRGEIARNNNALSSIVQNYLTSSQKVLDKKIQAYDFLWARILEVKEFLPSGISAVCQIFLDSEINRVDGFKYIDDNPNMSKVLRSYNLEDQMKPFLKSSNDLLIYKPYLSDGVYKLYYAYNALVGRMTHKFISHYQHKEVYNWKRDEHLNKILTVVLSDKEIEYIKELKTGSFPTTLDLLEHKILQDFKSNLNIQTSPEETIKYMRDIEKIMNLDKGST